MQNFDGTFWLSLTGILVGFASGALMGLFSGGLNAVKGGLDYGYNNIFNKDNYIF